MNFNHEEWDHTTDWAEITYLASSSVGLVNIKKRFVRGGNEMEDPLQFLKHCLGKNYGSKENPRETNLLMQRDGRDHEYC